MADCQTALKHLLSSATLTIRIFYELCAIKGLYTLLHLLSAAEPFITKDKSFEKQRKCSLSSSLARVKSGPPLLQDKQFFITPNVQPAPSDMSDIIKCAGGQVGGVSMWIM